MLHPNLGLQLVGGVHSRLTKGTHFNLPILFLLFDLMNIPSTFILISIPCTFNFGFVQQGSFITFHQIKTPYFSPLHIL